MAGDWLQRLVDDGVISQEQLDEADSMARRHGTTVDDILVKFGYADQEVISAAKASGFGYTAINLDEVEIPPNVITMIPESMARENTVIPLAFEDGVLKVAFHDPMAFDVLDKVHFMVNKKVEMVVAPKPSIQRCIDRHYGQSETESVDSIIAEFTDTQIDVTEIEVSGGGTIAEDENAPVIKLVNLVIEEAVKMRASDIHIEPFEDRIRIRYRIDGNLVERDTPPRRLLASIVSRIKIMARIDISEKRRPQDGRIKTRVGSADYDLRVSILPTNHGQAIVMRILDRENIKVGIRNLGFSRSEE